MSSSVFISYARNTSRVHAEALYEALGGSTGLAFLDTTGIDAGDPIPPVLLEALLGSRVVVLFADDAYFQSWYCQWELRATLAPFLSLPPGASEETRQATLAPIVVALPSAESPPLALDRLPPRLLMTLWPAANETLRLVELVRERLAEATQRLQDRIDTAGGLHPRTTLLEDAALPAPVSVAGFHPLHPLQHPPSLGSSFVGRAEELWRIHYALSTLRGDAVGATLTGSALEGGGGFGKTRLALEYLHRMGARYYRGGIFWVDADVTDDRLEEQLHGILRALKPGECPDLATFRELHRDVAKELAQALHESSGRGPILYVVDNVPEPRPGQARKPLEAWCPALGKVALLVTSRLKLLRANNLRPLTVDVLASAPAVALLTEGIRADVDFPSWLRIAEWVGSLPLALELLNRAMDAGGVTPGELLAKAVEEGPVRELDRQMEALRQDVEPRTLRGVTEALSISYEKLSEPAQRAARLLAWLAPEPIPLALLEALGEEMASPAVRAMLVSRHFIRPAGGGGVPFFGDMHRVLADFLQNESTEPAEDLTQLCTALLKLMTQAACRDAREWPLMNACLPHAERVLAHRAHLGLEDGIEEEIDLGRSLQSLLLAKGLAARARSLGESLIQRAADNLGAEHPDTLAAMTNLAETLYAQGAMSEAKKLQEGVVARCQQHLGHEDLVTLNAQSSLSRIMDAQGDSAGAQALLERALELMRRQLGPEHHNVIVALNNLGHLLHEQGRFDEARALQQQVVDTRRRLLGHDHPETLTAMNNLSVTLSRQGDKAGARALQREVLEARLKYLGEEHPSTLNTMCNLAADLNREGAYAEAQSFAEKAVEGLRRILGNEHKSVLFAMSTLASILRDQGKLAEARGLQEKILETAQKQLGDEHPKTLIIMGQLAGTLIHEGNLHRARVIQKKVLAAHLRLAGVEHPSTTVAAWTLAHIHHKLGEQRNFVRVVSDYLLWLLDQPPEALQGEQRVIRHHVAQVAGTLRR